MNDIEFMVNRDTQGVTGFTLQGNDEYDSYEEASFCLSFVAAQRVGKATVKVNDNKIVFTHNGITDPDPQLLQVSQKFEVLGAHQGGVRSFDLSPEDASALSQLLSREGDYATAQMRVRYELAWSNGFTLYVQPQAVKAT